MLHLSEERYRLLVASVRDYAIFMLDPKGYVLSWNAGAERIKGYRAEEIIGRHFSTFYPPEDIRAAKPEYELEVAAVEGRFEDEGWRLRKDGTPFWANVVITALRDEHGVLQGYGKVTRDLTERKQAEERARQLAREQAGRAEAEAANRHKDHFLAMLAHELRNPLAPVLTGLALLRQAGDDRQRRAATVDMMERQVRHLKRMVDDLLDVARLNRDKVELRTDRLDLARLVLVACDDRHRSFDDARLGLEVRTPETPVWVRGDEARLTQVLWNLLDNAAKFTEPGGRVVVTLDRGISGSEAVLRVRDTGVGIDPEFVPHLFEPFAQAGRGLATARGGLGLGLALVKGLVKRHGGQVEAYSPGPGRGSQFTLHLPAEPEPAALSAPPGSVPSAEHRLRVVIVEDNRDAAESLRLLLEVLGYETRVAHSGTEGLRTAVAWRPDAVLSDVGLPGLNGWDLAAQLRRHPATAGALLVGISGYGTDEDLLRARAAGFDHYLVKPADPNAIRRILAARSGDEDGTRPTPAQPVP
jgi:PAS domain S-box-containing protein